MTKLQSKIYAKMLPLFKDIFPSGRMRMGVPFIIARSLLLVANERIALAAKYRNSIKSIKV